MRRGDWDRAHEIVQQLHERRAARNRKVRRVAFGLMVVSGDPTMHAVVIEAGLASANSLLQAAAFKEAIMSPGRIHLVLTELLGSNRGLG